MVDFARALREGDRPRPPPGPCPDLVVGVTGHRPDKLPDRATGYRWDNQVRQWCRSEVERATRELVAEWRASAEATADHRPGYRRSDEDRWWLRHWLSRVEWAQRPGGTSWLDVGGVLCVTGGALGVDQDAAGVWLRMGLPYVVAAPFRGQELAWPERTSDGRRPRETYQRVLQHAAGVVYVSDAPPAGLGEDERTRRVRDAMGTRNDWVCTVSDRLVAVWDGSRGGTRDCLYRWNQHGRHPDTLRRVDPRDCQDHPDYERLRARLAAPMLPPRLT